MARRLVVCLDGTWNTESSFTNVWRINVALSRTADQRIYYDQGVGTKTLEYFTAEASAADCPTTSCVYGSQPGRVSEHLRTAASRCSRQHRRGLRALSAPRPGTRLRGGAGLLPAQLARARVRRSAQRQIPRRVRYRGRPRHSDRADGRVRGLPLAQGASERHRSTRVPRGRHRIPRSRFWPRWSRRCWRAAGGFGGRARTATCACCSGSRCWRTTGSAPATGRRSECRKDALERIATQARAASGIELEVIKPAKALLFHRVVSFLTLAMMITGFVIADRVFQDLQRPQPAPIERR